jgi:hypothetical protein
MSTHPLANPKELKEFLRARFHQDWIDEGSPEEIVAAYVKKSDPATNGKIAEQIGALLKDGPTEEELEAFCGEEARSDIFPPGLGLTYEKWLQWLAGALVPATKVAKAEKAEKPAAKKKAAPKAKKKAAKS